MSSSHVSLHRRKHKPPKRSKEEGHESENIHLLKNKRKSYIVGIIKVINSITELIDQNRSFSDFSKFDKSLESYIQNIRDLRTKIIGSESDDNVIQPELEMCIEQEFRVIQIRNAISSYFKNKVVSPINLKKHNHLLSMSFHRIICYQKLKLLYRLKTKFYPQVKH